MPEPPDDPRQTADLVPDQQSPTPETVGAGVGVESTGTTAPYLRPPPAPAGYQLLVKVGAGGMGVVWQARDLRLDRHVAIKLLKEGVPADSPAAARFVAEARLMGQLQHPGIPAVHELGSLPDGRPFLAMKLVKGQTLSELLKEYYPHPSPLAGGEGVAPPTPSGREDGGEGRVRFIAVFEQVCHAVGYAHAHKVIHRDLKPSNVMVGAHGEVQVMDWGLAKVLTDPASYELERGEEDPEATVGLATAIDTPERDDSATRTGSVLGTPAYMPPEQAGGEIRKLDARSDVFGLGAILCQILTGRSPYHGSDSNAVRLQAVRWEVAEAFAALDSSGAEPELVALCKRCLARQQADRPADGRAVAAEVARIRQAAEERARQAELEQQRALVREAEQRKRRRVVQVGAGLIAAVLLAGVIGTGWGLIEANQARDAEKRRADAEAAAKQDADAQRDQARQERDAKDAALKAEEQAKLQAETRRQEAERNLAFAKKGNELLGSVFTGLDPKANYATVSELRDALKANLEKAVRELEGTAIGEPLEVAAMQNTLGSSLLGLGEPKLAITVFEKALATRQAQLGPDHPNTLASMNNLAMGYRAAGQLDKALPLYEETLKLMKAKLGPDHPSTLTSMNNLAMAYRDAGQLDKALPLLEETLKLTKAKLGPDHPHTLISMNNLAEGYRVAGQLDKALPLYEETLRLMKAKLGPDHPNTLASMNNLAMGYRAAGQLDKALPLYEETLRLRKAQLGPDHPDTLGSMNNLAEGYQAAGQLDKALPLLEETLKLTKAKLGPDHPHTLISMNNLAEGYRAAGQLDRALPLFEETLKLTRARLGPDHPSTLTSMGNLAGGYRDAGQLDRALPLFEEAAQGIEKRRFQHELARHIIPNTIHAYEEAKQFDKAEAWRRKWAAHVKVIAGADSLPYAGELAALALNLLQQKKYSEAEGVLRECLAVREKKQPEAWTTFNTMSMLGGALLGRAGSVRDGAEKARLLADAEPLLLKGYEGMKEREKTIPPPGKPRLTEALERLIELYTAWEKPDEVKKWQAEKDKLPPPPEKGSRSP